MNEKPLLFLFLIVQTFLLFMLKDLGNIQIFMARLFLSHIPWRMGDAAYLGGENPALRMRGILYNK